MNIKLKTNEQLSVTAANGLAGVFVNGVSLSASLSSKADLTALQNCYTKSETSSANEISTALESAGSKVYFDNHISSISGSNDLSVVKLSAAEYAQMLDGGTCLSNAIYIVEAPNIDAFKQRITNVAPATDLSDAVNLEQVSSAIADLSNIYQAKGEYLSVVPIAENDIVGGIKTGFVQNGHNYPVQLSNQQAYVNVPWTDVAVQSAWYDPNENQIVIKFNDENTDTISVDVSDLIDVYTAGQTQTISVGISNNSISADIMPSSITPELLSATADWIFDCNHY